MAKESAGLLLYRGRAGRLELLLVHPGGPFWKNKDAGAWTIPKGEIRSQEEPLATAQREFEEELGFKPQGQFLALTPVKQKGGKLVHGWALEGDCDPAACKSNTFTMQWPPRSGRVQEFPEVDQVAFFDMTTAKEKINPAQIAFLEELEGKLGAGRA
ncbi:MAG TPA: NUDIX domain-containing protein [Candidatus Sulfotelmatobacter sp.]|nr:NUDIX domain-containing protein [Candidatus Sulfotelmatobacter sp.]